MASNRIWQLFRSRKAAVATYTGAEWDGARRMMDRARSKAIEIGRSHFIVDTYLGEPAPRWSADPSAEAADAGWSSHRWSREVHPLENA
jgi:hypothetical protein